MAMAAQSIFPQTATQEGAGTTEHPLTAAETACRELTRLLARQAARESFELPSDASGPTTETPECSA